MIPHSKTSDPDGGPALAQRSERMLRWKSRENFTELNFEQASAESDADRSNVSQQQEQEQQQGQSQAGPRQSGSPSRNGKPGVPYVRPESPSRRGESVRRRASIDFDSLESSSEKYTSQFDPSLVVPSFRELLNHPPAAAAATAPRDRKSQSPKRSAGAFAAAAADGKDSRRVAGISSTGAAAAEEWKSRKGSKSLIKPEERSQILKARKLLEFRSSAVKAPQDDDTAAAEADATRRSRRPEPGDAFRDQTMTTTSSGHNKHDIRLQQLRKSDSATLPAPADDSSSCEFIDLADMAKEMVNASTKSFRPTTSSMLSPRNGYENVYFSPRSDKFRNQILQQQGGGGGGGAAGDAAKCQRSSPRIEFSGLLSTGDSGFQVRETSSPRSRDKELSSPQIRARNAFLERLHGERGGGGGGGHGRSDSMSLHTPPARESSAGVHSSVRRGEPQSQSARYASPAAAGQRTSDYGSPRAPPRGSTAKAVAYSSLPHHGLRRVLDSTARTSGLSLSCRRASIADDVFEEREASPHYYPSHVATASRGCRPSPLKQSASASSDERGSSRGVHEKGQQGHRVPRPPPGGGAAAGGDQSIKALVLRNSKQAPARPPSPAKSFKKWVASQFHFGGLGKKNKDGVQKLSPLTSPDSQQQIQRAAADGRSSASPWTVKLPAELLGNVARNTSPAAAHRLPKPPPAADSGAENGGLERSRLSTSSAQSIESNGKDGSSRRHEKKSSHRHLHDQSGSTRSPANPSGPLKFQGLQSLFATDAASPKPPISSHEADSDQAQTDTDGQPKRTMKFLECPEIADLNEFLRAKRECYSSCQTNGKGYLKFISTEHPTDEIYSIVRAEILDKTNIIHIRTQLSRKSDIGSMVSAICYSYFLEKRPNGPGRWNVVPLINFPRWQMKDHLDAAWLFNVSGLDVKALLFADEVDFEGLSKVGTTTRTMLVGEHVLKKNDEVGSCCTLLAETIVREAEPLWSRSSPFLKTLLLSGLLMDTDNLSKSSTSTSRDHQMLLNLSTGAGPLGRFGLFDRMRTVYSDPEVLKMAKKYYGITEEQCTDASRPAPPPPPPPARKAKKSNETKLLSPKGSPLFSSEADDNSRSSGSPTSNSSSSERSRSNSPATIHPTDKPQPRSLLSRLPTDAHKPPLQGIVATTRKSAVAY
ncbi:hypothetical protein MPTK2_4g22580 [Marchantia polymorpha subsp. ruderalis]